MKAGRAASPWSRVLFWTGLLNGLVLCGLLIEVFFNHRFAEGPFWLMGSWNLLIAQGLLAIVVMVRRLLQRRWVPALVWLLWAGLGLGLCAAAMLPVLALSGLAGVSVDEPPPGSPGRIEGDRADSLWRIKADRMDSLSSLPNPVPRKPKRIEAKRLL